MSFRIRNPQKRAAIDVDLALQELLLQLSEQNLGLDIRKVKDKPCVYELKVPQAKEAVMQMYQQVGVRERAESRERQTLQANLLGIKNINMLASEKAKQRVKESNKFKQIKLCLSGEKLMVRFGAGYCDFLEFLDKKGLISYD